MRRRAVWSTGWRIASAAVLTAWLCACTSPSRTDPSPLPSAGLSDYRPPEGASGYTPKPGWATRRFAVAAANPLATDAGYQVLKAGGTAVDAAVAVQMVLTLVEPQSSGIGGGAFLLHTNGTAVEAYDGRETAPAAATEQLFLGADGQPMAFEDAVVGGRSVGTPGTVALLEQAHREHGKLPWARLIAPAITLADNGFPVSARLAALIKGDRFLRRDRTAAAYFYRPDGSPVSVGTVLRNPALAEVLRGIARQGAAGLMMGPVAQAVVTAVQSHPVNPGALTLADLARYTAKKRDPICHDQATRTKTYLVCGMPPPSSGAIAIGQILGMLAHTPADSLPLVPARGSRPDAGPTPSADWLHLYTEASRLAFADRAQYVADPDFIAPPGGSWLALLDPGYLKLRAQLIAPKAGGASMRVARPGQPGPLAPRYAPMPEQPENGTSHISIVDAYGNALAMTTTIEDQFGARVMTDGGTGKPGGFLLNNQLTDFSFSPVGEDGRPVANRLEPGKRPRSSMAPTLVFDKSTGRLVMSVGSPGGAMIIHFTAKTLYGVLHWGLSAQQAIDLPNFGSLNGPSLLEAKRFDPATVAALRGRGAEVREQALTSGLQAIQTTPDGFFGGADPRREGLVLGD